MVAFGASGKMVAMPFLVDGHNLIPKLGLHLDSPDDEMQLVDVLQEFARLSRREVVIYFDGGQAGQASMRRFGTVSAHFVRAGRTADDAIKAHVQRLGRAARNWTVVTSDRVVQNEARSMHAAVLSSEEFAARLKRLPGKKERPAAERELTPEEIEQWLRDFGGGK